MGKPRARLALGQHEIDAGIETLVALRRTRTGFEHERILPGAVLQVMAVLVPRLESRAIAGAQDLFTLVGDQHYFAGHDEHELVFTRMPVALARPGARLESGEVHTELREPGRIAQVAASARHARLVVRRRIA